MIFSKGLLQTVTWMMYDRKRSGLADRILCDLKNFLKDPELSQEIREAIGETRIVIQAKPKYTEDKGVEMVLSAEFPNLHLPIWQVLQVKEKAAQFLSTRSVPVLGTVTLQLRDPDLGLREEIWMRREAEEYRAAIDKALLA